MTQPPPTTDLGTDGPLAARSRTPIAIRSQLEPGDLGTVVRLHGREGAEHGLDASFEAEVARGVADLAISWTRSPDAGRIWLAGPPDDPRRLHRDHTLGSGSRTTALVPRRARRAWPRAWAATVR
jgi:hypothetical protein